MMENVPGLSEHWSFRNFCRELRRIGYRVRWDVKDASRYSVPQRRKRLILLAGHGFDIPFAKELKEVAHRQTGDWRPFKAGQKPRRATQPAGKTGGKDSQADQIDTEGWRQPKRPAAVAAT